jgi:hypothetical protein
MPESPFESGNVRGFRQAMSGKPCGDRCCSFYRVAPLQSPAAGGIRMTIGNFCHAVALIACLAGGTGCVTGSGSLSGSPPATPTNASASAISSTTVHVTWVCIATDATAFAVERSTSATDGFVQVGTALGTASAHDDSNGLLPSTMYYYRVRATNSAGASGYSNVASAQTFATETTPPAAPGGAGAVATSSSVIRVSWIDNSSNEEGFQIQRSTSSSSGFSQVGMTSAGATSLDDGGLAAATTYFYRVRATNAAGNSGWSNVASATTQATTPPPTNVAAALAVLANRAIFFDHASVGMNVMNGVEALLNSASGAHPTRASLEQGTVGASAIAQLGNGVWMDHYYPDSPTGNGYPLNKMDAFQSTDLGGGLGAKLNALGGIAFMKLCFADFDGGTSQSLTTNATVDQAFVHFQSTMSALQGAYPNVKFVYLTSALRGGGNGMRERYNQHVRDTYGGTGRVFDLADAESNGQSDAEGRILSSAFNDGTDHLNSAGQAAVARALVLFLAGL